MIKIINENNMLSADGMSELAKELRKEFGTETANEIIAYINKGYSVDSAIQTVVGDDDIEMSLVIDRYDDEPLKYDRATDLDRFQDYWSDIIRDIAGEDLSAGEIDDIALDLFYYELQGPRYTEDEVIEIINQML